MPLPREPQRRTDAQRRRHLDAHEVALERALLARAAELDAQSMKRETDIAAVVDSMMAAEFRALAAELHHW